MLMRCGVLGVQYMAWMAVAMAFATALVSAQENDSADTADNSEAEKRRRAGYVRAMRTMAEGLEVVRLTDDGATECSLLEDAVLNWSDSARHPDLLVPGTTWIWHHKGRPGLIGEIYGRVDSVGSWHFFSCNLSPDRVRFADGAFKTTITKSYYEAREMPDAPAVAQKKTERTIQMRALVDRFDAHQFWIERFELRLLPKPIYRYEDAESGILDGAVYAMVHGTNPEVLLLIEAHKTDDRAAKWKVSFGSLAGARCVLRLDGKEFWTCPQHAPDPDDPRQSYAKFVAIKEPEPDPDRSTDND